jgi:hypothetical protein
MYIPILKDETLKQYATRISNEHVYKSNAATLEARVEMIKAEIKEREGQSMESYFVKYKKRELEGAVQAHRNLVDEIEYLNELICKCEDKKDGAPKDVLFLFNAALRSLREQRERARGVLSMCEKSIDHLEKMTLESFSIRWNQDPSLDLANMEAQLEEELRKIKKDEALRSDFVAMFE